MKIGLMVVSPNKAGLSNIGDYIQAHAARQYFNHIDIFVDRDWELNRSFEEGIKMIMNGWFMDHPENFPPSENIKPLFVSIHINSYGLPEMLRKECVDYFKRHQPIGCRDENTVMLLKEQGIDAYFSGCLTLTLGRKYRFDGKREGIYIVDPHFSTKDISKRPLLFIKSLFSLLGNYKSIRSIAQKKGSVSIRSLIHNSVYYKEYCKVFDKEILLNAHYINQMNTEIGKMSVEERMNYAEILIQMYARAECVITSRIHCALPCLGLETPVLFVTDSEATQMSTMRFGGLLDLLNTIEWKNERLVWATPKITRSNFPKNKDTWKGIANELVRRCVEFVQKY